MCTKCVLKGHKDCVCVCVCVYLQEAVCECPDLYFSVGVQPADLSVTLGSNHHSVCVWIRFD